MFDDRSDAGRQLASKLAALGLARPVVYALPRGGVPVAVPVAAALHAPLDLMMVRKISAPGAPELALGAVVEGIPPETVINESVRRGYGVDEGYLARTRAFELSELERRRGLYLGDRGRVDPSGCSAILVDDGLATGATMKAALIATRRRGAARVVVAVPVAPEEALPEFAALADQVICLHPSRFFRGVGGVYRDFHQLSDAETVDLLRRAWSGAEAKGPPPTAG